jgi:hypothetical protein
MSAGIKYHKVSFPDSSSNQHRSHIGSDAVEAALKEIAPRFHSSQPLPSAVSSTFPTSGYDTEKDPPTSDSDFEPASYSRATQRRLSNT